MCACTEGILEGLLFRSDWAWSLVSHRSLKGDVQAVCFVAVSVKVPPTAKRQDRAQIFNVVLNNANTNLNVVRLLLSEFRQHFQAKSLWKTSETKIGEKKKILWLNNDVTLHPSPQLASFHALTYFYFLRPLCVIIIIIIKKKKKTRRWWRTWRRKRHEEKEEEEEDSFPIVFILLPFGLIYINTFQKRLWTDVTLTQTEILIIYNESNFSPE